MGLSVRLFKELSVVRQSTISACFSDGREERVERPNHATAFYSGVQSIQQSISEAG